MKIKKSPASIKQIELVFIQFLYYISAHMLLIVYSWSFILVSLANIHKEHKSETKIKALKGNLVREI
jgi:hypothetical protein